MLNLRIRRILGPVARGFRVGLEEGGDELAVPGVLWVELVDPLLELALPPGGRLHCSQGLVDLHTPLPHR
jgi:hypothetical protein